MQNKFKFALHLHLDLFPHLYSIFNVKLRRPVCRNFELPEHLACRVELLAVGGALCHLLYCRLGLLKVALGTTNFVGLILQEFELTWRACSILHLIAVALGFLMVNLPFLVTTSTYFFPAPVQLTAADHSSVFFSLDVSTVYVA